MSNMIEEYANGIRARLETGDVNRPEDYIPGGSLEQKQALTFDDHFGYQQAQAKACVTGKITTEEAQTIYNALGECVSEANGGWSEHVDLALKLTVTQIVGELLGVA